MGAGCGRSSDFNAKPGPCAAICRYANIHCHHELALILLRRNLIDLIDFVADRQVPHLNQKSTLSRQLPFGPNVLGPPEDSRCCRCRNDASAYHCSFNPIRRLRGTGESVFENRLRRWCRLASRGYHGWSFCSQHDFWSSSGHENPSPCGATIETERKGHL